jgi:cell wall assembly regulator SMI1
MTKPTRRATLRALGLVPALTGLAPALTGLAPALRARHDVEGDVHKRTRLPFRAFEAWLANHLPETHADLRPGVEASQLEALAREIGVQELPRGFSDLYRWHDGQSSEVPDDAGRCSRDPFVSGIWWGLPFITLDGVLDEWRRWDGVIDSLASSAQDLDAEARSTPPGAIKLKYAHRGWLPFAKDWGGNHIGVDLDPGPDGTYGQVINFGRDEFHKRVLARSVEDFVAWMARELDAGNFSIDDRHDVGRVFRIAHPANTHFLDAIQQMAWPV